MTDYTATSGKHATLAANTMDSVTLSLNTDIVEIINRDLANPIYVTVGTTPLSSVPNATVAGDNTMAIPGGQVRTVRVNATAPTVDAVVKLIGGSASAYSVQAGGQ